MKSLCSAVLLASLGLGLAGCIDSRNPRLPTDTDSPNDTSKGTKTGYEIHTIDELKPRLV